MLGLIFVMLGLIVLCWGLCAGAHADHHFAVLVEWLLKGFGRASEGLPKGFRRASERLPKGFGRASKGLPKGF